MDRSLFLRLLRAVFILPVPVLGLFPLLILWLPDRSALPTALKDPFRTGFWLGLILLVPGLVLMIWTVSLFVRKGRGTPAPWDPPQRLVILGPYQYVRNPMIIGVLLVLLAEALALRSWFLFAWWLLFFAGNNLYFSLIEERWLERRFGEAYCLYKRNVRRWLPRFRPWSEPCNGERRVGT